jgi:hypothetical protein
VRQRAAGQQARQLLLCCRCFCCRGTGKLFVRCRCGRHLSPFVLLLFT